MDSLMIAAAGGMRSRLEALDLIANNIANSSAAGYKADHESGQPYISPQALRGSKEAWRPDAVVAPDNDKHWTDHTQGSLARSSEPMDFALYGGGFFEVKTQEGPRWTRNGSFEISRSGKLQTSEGHELRVRPIDGSEFRLDPGVPLNVQRDGTIYQDGRPLGVIEVMSFSRLDLVAKQGGNYFRMDDPTQVPVPAVGTEVRQGYLEAANTGATQSAVRLVAVMRHFESLQRAMSLGAEMNKKTIEDVGRLGS